MPPCIKARTERNRDLVETLIFALGTGWRSGEEGPPPGWRSAELRPARECRVICVMFEGFALIMGSLFQR